MKEVDLDRLHIASAVTWHVASCCMQHNPAAWPCHKGVGPWTVSTNQTYTCVGSHRQQTVSCNASMPFLSVQLYITARCLLRCFLNLHLSRMLGLDDRNAEHTEQ